MREDERSQTHEAELYENFLFSKNFEWERMCLCCGACCGVTEGDPCSQRVFNSDTHKYFCRIYSNRLGPQLSQSGRVFNCVPIRNILHKNWPGDHHCSYKKGLGIKFHIPN